MNKATREIAKECETLEEAIEEARIANQHGNGIGATIPFFVAYDGFNISVVRKLTPTRGRFLLFTVEGSVLNTGLKTGAYRTTEIIRRQARGAIDEALGIAETDLSVSLEKHQDKLTAIVPTDL